MNCLNIHLSIPVSPEDNNCVWVHALSIPVESIVPLSLYPFKLLRYICYVILAARGELSLSQDLEPAPIPYESQTVDIIEIPPDGVLNIYYHVNTNEQPYVFPLDPQLERLTVTTSESEHSLRRADFRAMVTARDGTCVATGYQMEFCDVAHLIAVNKGDDYIKILTEARSVNHHRPMTIDDINDIRNGLLLLMQIHRSLGKRLAFLPLPNEYMESQDVRNALSGPERSYILHDLKSQLTPLDPTFIPQGSSLHISSQGWPPDILFDTVYAAAVMSTWGTGSQFRDHVMSGWTEKFYGGTPVDKRDGGKGKMEKEQTQTTQQQQQQSESRANRYERRSGWQATEPDILDLLMAAHQLIHAHRASAPTEQDLSESVQSKVQEWLATSQQFETGVDAH